MYELTLLDLESNPERKFTVQKVDYAEARKTYWRAKNSKRVRLVSCNFNPRR